MGCVSQASTKVSRACAAGRSAESRSVQSSQAWPPPRATNACRSATTAASRSKGQVQVVQEKEEKKEIALQASDSLTRAHAHVHYVVGRLDHLDHVAGSQHWRALGWSNPAWTTLDQTLDQEF